jgi:hypothetical protein
MGSHIERGELSIHSAVFISLSKLLRRRCLTEYFSLPNGEYRIGLLLSLMLRIDIVFTKVFKSTYNRMIMD